MMADCCVTSLWQHKMEAAAKRKRKGKQSTRGSGDNKGGSGGGGVVANCHVPLSWQC